MALRCKLFGHIWTVHSYEGDGKITVRPSDWCHRCGLKKSDVYQEKAE